MNISDEAIVKRLVESEVGQKAASDIIRDHHLHRIDLKAQIEKLKRERGQQGRELADSVEVTRKRLEQARKVLTEAEQEHRVAVMQQQQIAAHFGTRISKLERKLLETAPASISDFISWLNDEESTCKSTAILESSERTDKLNTHTSEIIRRYFNNAASLRHRLAAIRKAKAEAESLKPLILDAADLEARLQTLRDSLPAVTMEYSHER